MDDSTPSQMTYPFFRRGLIDTANPERVRAEDVPTFDRRRADAAEDYIPHPDLSHAVNVALALGMPLLLTGAPGTGKTQLAYALGNDLSCPVHKFETKSTSAAKDLFYTFDALSAFKMDSPGFDVSQFIHYQALGKAILEAFPAEDIPEGMLNQASQHSGPRRSVVLIDEIDKAPRDFPNDLLNEIDRLYFRVPELRNIGSPGADQIEQGDESAGVAPEFRPIVVLTSNSEKGLPDPFLRRCVYFDIPFPEPEQMLEIVSARVKRLGRGDPMLADAIDLFYDLRHDRGRTKLQKEPSTAELLNWLNMLLMRGVEPGQSLRAQIDVVQQTISTLVKNGRDRSEALNHVESKWKLGAASG